MSEETLTLKTHSLNNHLRKLIKVQTNDILTETEYLYLSEKYEDAEMLLLTSYPKTSISTDAEALTLIGNIQRKLNKNDLALKYFKNASECNDAADPFVDDCLGMAYYVAKDYTQSCTYFEEAVHLNKKEPIYHLHLAFVNEKLMDVKSQNQNDKMIAGEDVRINRVRNQN